MTAELVALATAMADAGLDDAEAALRVSRGDMRLANALLVVWRQFELRVLAAPTEAHTLQ